MSEYEKKTYVPKSYAKARQTKIGEIIQLDFQADALIEFIKQHKNERGYLKLDVIPKKTPGEFGTHSVALNTWKPTGQKPKSKIDDDDVPF